MMFNMMTNTAIMMIVMMMYMMKLMIYMMKLMINTVITDDAQVPESIKNYILVILIIAGCTFVLRLIVILWRMFRSQFKNLLKVQSEVQGQEENRICPSVRLSDPNDPKIGGFAMSAFVFAFSDFVLFVQRVSSGFTSVGIFGQFI